MANNKVSSLLNFELPRPKRSNFNLGRVNRFTADVGFVIPCYVEEVLPNSYKRLDVNALIQTNATIAPLMGSFKVNIDAYFVPLRLYHRHLSLNNVDVDFNDDFDFHFISSVNQTIESTLGRNSASISVAPSSLLDYLGIFPVGFNSRAIRDTFKVNAEPFIGYFDIWRNYYSNPHDRLVPYRVRNVPFDSSNLVANADDQGIFIKYFNLEDLDTFILSISSKSIDTVGSPVAIDAMRQFATNVRCVDESNLSIVSAQYQYATSVPFYQNQLNASYTTSVGLFDIVDTNNGLHFGLLPRTYMDDYFNSRFMNEFVSYMEEQSVVNVENNQFNISQLRVANRIAKFVDKSIFADTRFGSWIKAHYGVSTNNKLDIPQFLGRITSNIVFNDIYATAQTSGVQSSVTENTALGSRASLGQGFIKNKGSFVEFKATEPGYLMCVFSIQPYVSYTQGIRKMYLKTSFNDVFKPEFDAIGYQDLQRLEMDAIGYHYKSNIPHSVGTTAIYLNDSGVDKAGPLNYVVGKQPAWLEYMTSFDECHGLMTVRNEYGFWTLNRPFNPEAYEDHGIYYSYDEDTGAITSVTNDIYLSPNNPLGYSNDVSTYINSDYFNGIFAVNKWYDNFQVQIRFYDRTKQPMSKQVLPHL